MADDANEVTNDDEAPDTVADLAAEVQDSFNSSGASADTLTLVDQFVSAFLKSPDAETPDGSNTDTLISEVEEYLDLGVSDPDIGQHILSQIEDVANGTRAASTDSPLQNVDQRADPIEMFSGQFLQQSMDLRISGAGMDFEFRRTYRSQALYAGPLGANWDHAYNLHLRESGPLLIRTSGELRSDLYRRHPLFGQGGFNYWVPPDGQHGVIEQSGGSFAWRSPAGVRLIYEREVTDPTLHRIARIEDRFGNYLAFTYIEENLRRVEINHPARLVVFDYDELDRVVALRDHTGRQWTYTYDDYGDLASVTSPSTDRYPAGLTTQYEYSSSDFSGVMQHNLLRIIDPAGLVYLENTYGVQPGLLSFNRVVRQRQGNGEFFFDYETVVDEFEIDYSDLEKPAIQVNQMLRNGQPVHMLYNRFGNLVLREEYLLQAGLENLVRWRYRYNADGALIASLSPEGCLTQYYYGRDDYLRVWGITDAEVAMDDNLSSAARLAFGNLLATVFRGVKYDFAQMDLSLGAWGDFFPDLLAATGPDIIIKRTYEPDYQQPLTISDPRFTARADPRFPEAVAYTQHLTRYEYSGSPLKTLSATHYPDTSFPAALPDGTTGLSGISELYVQYDARGRLQRAQDAEGNISTNVYVPETPADPTSGYLQSSTQDSAGLQLQTAYTRNAVGMVTAVRNPRGVLTTFVVNALDQVALKTSGGPGFTTRYYYNENGLLERQERTNSDDLGQASPDGPEVMTWLYDEQNNLVKETRGGDLTQHHVIRHLYDGSDCLVQTTFAMGNKITFEYDERMLVIATTRGAFSDQRATKKAIYDMDGRQITAMDARKNRTSYAYDTFGRLTTTVDPLGNIFEREYDKLGNPIVARAFERRPDGTYYLLSRSAAEFDARGNRIAQTDYYFQNPILTPQPIPTAQHPQSPDAGFTAAWNQGTVSAYVTQFFYDGNRRLFRSVNPQGHESVLAYDGANRKVREQDAMGNYAQTSYDENSNVTRIDRHETILDPVLGTVLGEEVFSVLNTYDLLDRRSTMTDSLGNSTRFGCDSRDNVLSVTDPLGNVQRRQYDVFGRMTESLAQMTSTGLGGGTRSADVTVVRGYDLNDRLITLTDGNGQTSSFDYDELDRVTATSLPDGTTAVQAYDPDDNVTLRKDNNGLQVIFTVDPLSRLIAVALDRSQVTANYIYPPGAEIWEQHSYDGLGRGLQRTNDFVSITSQFDSLGRCFAESVQITAANAPGGPFALQRSFDELGNRTEVLHPSGRSVHYEYDPLSRISGIRNTANGAQYPGSGHLGAQYDVARFQYRGLRLAQVDFGNQTGCDYAYDGAGRVISSTHRRGAQTLLGLQQLFDGAGNRRLQLETPPLAAQPNGERYELDSMYRLTRFARNPLAAFNPAQFAPATAVVLGNAFNGQTAIDAFIGAMNQHPNSSTYQYDAAGNRKRERLPGQAARTYVANALNEYSAIDGNPQGYDLNGNLVDDGAVLYAYDWRNQLVAIHDKASGAQLLQLGYDAFGRLSIVTQPGQSITLINDGPRVIEEYIGAAVTSQYVYDGGLDQRCQMAGAGNEWWYHRDILLSPRILTDSNGMATARYSYEPYGRLLGGPAQANPYGFAGKRLLMAGNVSIYDSRARQYSPTLGRFLQRDPLGFVDGPNLYVYGGNNPVTYIDRSGTEKSEASESEGEDLEHAGHRIHQLHGAGDAAEIAEQSGKVAETLEELEKATKLLNDLAGQEIHINKFLAAQKAVRFNQLEKYAKAVAHAKEAGILAKDSEVLRKIVIAIGGLSAKAEALLEEFQLGRFALGTARFLTNKWTMRTMVALNTTIEGARGYLESPAQTTSGKIGSGVLGAGGGFLVVASNPYVAVADVALPEGYKISEVMRGTAAAVPSLVEGLATDDTRAAQSFHDKSKAGNYGVVMKLASESGEWWAKQGISGGLDALIWQIKN